MSAMTSSHDPVIPDELLPALHEEIARLPERLRLAVVLCDLKGSPRPRPPSRCAGASGPCDVGWPRARAAQGPARSAGAWHAARRS